MVRDESQKLLVIGGPFDGQRMARVGNEFTEVVGPKTVVITGATATSCAGTQC